MKEIFFISQRCRENCEACRSACITEHLKNQPTYTPLDRLPFAKKRATNHYYHSLQQEFPHPLRCIHCEEPACIEACISGSMAKDDVGGRVANHLVQCVGCWMCVMSCPYSAAVPSTKKSIKCDYCLFGEAPSCVRACPTKALVFCEPQEYERRLQLNQKWRERR